jgi:hypothetical protein
MRQIGPNVGFETAQQHSIEVQISQQTKLLSNGCDCLTDLLQLKEGIDESAFPMLPFGCDSEDTFALSHPGRASASARFTEKCTSQ